MSDQLRCQVPSRPLSLRELAVLNEVTSGVCNREIACILGIAQASVHVHLKRLLKKFGAPERAQVAIILASENAIGGSQPRNPRETGPSALAQAV
jgi:DNA-binding NarL/FixJ family response regulator